MGKGAKEWQKYKEEKLAASTGQSNTSTNATDFAAKGGASAWEEYKKKTGYAEKSKQDSYEFSQKAFDQARTGYDVESKYDIEAGQKAIEELKAELQKLKPATASESYVNGRPYAASQQTATNNVYNTGYGTVNNMPYAAGQQAQKVQQEDPDAAKRRELEKQITQKQQEVNLAKRIQNKQTLAAADQNADFDEYSGYVSTYEDSLKSKLLSKYGMGYDDLTYEYINNRDGIRDKIEGMTTTYGYETSSSESPMKKKGYDLLTENETAIYNYYYAKEGKKKAEAYLDSIQEDLNQRKATGMFEVLEDNTALEMVFGIEVGLDQFKTNMKSAANFKDDYIPQSAHHIASGMAREDLADDGYNFWYDFKDKQWKGTVFGNSVGQVAYDTITTTANMAPSTLTSLAVGLLNPGAGAAVGAALMGVSSSGGAYQEALNAGYDKVQARKYSALVGASEAGLQYLLGGISSLGGKISGNVVGKMVNGIDKAWAAAAVKIGGNMLSEGAEEALQEILTPMFKNWVLMADEDVNWSEVAYSGLLGALTASFMEGPDAIITTATDYRTGKQLLADGISATRLAEFGKTLSADSAAYQIAGKVNENTGAYKIGRLFNEIQATMTEQNVSEITEALIEKGFDRATARKNAEILAYVVEGGTLTEDQIAVMEANTALAEAAKEVLIDENTTWNQRAKGYHDVLQEMAMEVAKGKKGAAAETAQTTAEETSADETESKSIVNSTGEEASVKEIASIKNGKMTLRLEDGSTVDASDVSYATKDEALLYETIAQMDTSANIANILVKSFHTAKNNGLTATAYALGIDEAFQYGKIGIPMKELTRSEYASKLSAAQQEFVYRQGVKNAGKNIAKEQAAKKSTKAKATKPGKVHFERKGRTFDSMREVSLKTMEQLAKALGIEFYVYESYVKDGKRVYKNAKGEEVNAPNGFYDSDDGSIHIDLNAGNDGKGTMLFTVAHELAHFIKEWSPAKFKILANFLMEQYGQKDVPVSKLVDAQIAKAKRDERTLTREQAYEEVVADSMEAMLTDGNVVQMMAELKQRDKSLWQKICDWFKDLAADLKAIVETYKGVKPDSNEGKMVAQMQDVIVILESLYADALVEASENFQSAEKNTTREGDVKYQARRLTEKDLSAYLRAGTRANKSKVSALKAGQQIILTSAHQIKQFINNAIDKKLSSNTTVAYGKVNDRLADDVLAASDGNIKIKDDYLELIPDNLQHAYEQHHIAKQAGDVDLQRSDFENIPEYLDSYTEVVYAIEYSSGKVSVCVSKRLPNGRILLIETVSKSRGALQFKNAIGVSESKYQSDYVSVYKKRAGTNTRGSNSSNNSLRDDSNSIISIRNSEPEVKKYSARDSDGNQLSEEQQEYFKDSVVRDENGNLKVMYHGTSSGGHTVFDPYGKAKYGLFGGGSYFTDSKTIAESYTKKGKGKNPQVYETYLNIKNPIDMDAAADPAAWAKAFPDADFPESGTNEQFYRAMEEYFEDNEYPRWEAQETAMYVIEDMGYDGVTHIGGGRVNADGERHRVYIAFNPEQIKNVDNQKPTADPDIRYSERDQKAAEVNKVLEQENEELREDVAYLKEMLKLQRQVTGGTKFTRSSVEAAAGMLMKNADAKGNKAELAKLLNDLYEFIAKGDELTWEGVVDAAQPAVEWLASHVKAKELRSSYAQEVLKEIRGRRISLDEHQKKEVAYQYGSYNEFRKKAMGSVTFTDKDAISLDSQWHEWSEMYPNIFDPEISSNDMPAALMDAFRTLRSMTEMDAFSYDVELFKQDLTRQVYDSYWRAATLRTVADAKQKEINRLKGKHKERMDKLREYHKDKTEQLKAEHREELKQVRAEYRAKAEQKQKALTDKWQESRAKSVENRNKTAMRHKIQNVVKELNSLLLNDDKKRHVPDSLKKAVADALDLVNMDTVDAEARAAHYKNLIAKEEAKENPDQAKIDAYTVSMENILRKGEKMGKRIQELHRAYEEIQNSNDPDIANAYDHVIAGAIKELGETIGDTSLKNMSMEQLSDVYDVYKMVLHRVREANKAMEENIKETITQLAQDTVSEVKRVGGEKKDRVAFMDPVKQFWWNNFKPVYAMEAIGSSTLSKLFDNVRAGEDVWAKDIKEAKSYYQEKAKKYGHDKWNFGKKYKFTSDSGIDFKLTLEQIMSLYAYSRREQALDHLRLGGFVFDSNIETKKEKKLVKYKINTADAHQVTPEILADIVGTLTDEQKRFVEDMQEYLSTVMGAKGNEVTSKMYGVKLFKEKFYFPLKSAKQFMFEQNEVAGEVKIKNSGFTNKVAPKANNPVVLSNFMDVWSGHVNDMSMYHAFTLPLEDFNRVFNFNSPKKEGVAPVSVKGTIQNAYGPAAGQYVKQLITDLNGGARSDPRTGFINKAMGMYKKGAVFASLSVVVQQPSAIARATALIDTKYFIGSKIDQKRHKALWEEVKEYAPVAIIKEMGYFDTNMGMSTNDYITAKEYEGLWQKMKALVTDSNYRDEVLSLAPALADELAWCGIWSAVKRETKAKHPNMETNSEAFLKLAGKRFTEVIVKTQVYDSVLSRSANMRSKDTGMKMATAFMAEPTTGINMIADAILKGKRGDKKYARTAIGSVIAAQLLNSILVSFVYAARDEDEDETYLEKYLGSLAGGMIDGINPATYIPFIKDIVSIVKGYEVERSDMAVISDLWNAWKKLKSENVSAYRKVEDFAGSIAQIFGLPVKNIMRDVRSIYNVVTSITGIKDTTLAGIKYATGEELTGKSVSNKEQLYEARLIGDDVHAARVQARYEDKDAADAAVRSAIRDKFLEDEIDEETAIEHMMRYGGYDEEKAHWKMEEWKYTKDTGPSDGYGKYEKFTEAVRSGNNLNAVIKEYTSNGVKLSTLAGQITEVFKPEYMNANPTSRNAMKKYLTDAYVRCGVEREDALDKFDVWEWEAKGYKDVTAAAIRDYEEHCVSANVPKDVYLRIRKFANNTENDVDENGKSINFSAMKKIMAEIHKQRLTDDQKTAIAKSLGWSEKNIQKYKLW